MLLERLDKYLRIRVMIKPVKMPRCVANLFAIGNSAELTITETFEYRPDKIPEALNMPSMREEIIDNYMSNKSPITLRKGDVYTVTDGMFKGYFANA